MKTKRPRFVEVQWYDAASTAEWTERNSLPKTAKCVSRGWLLCDDGKTVTLAATLQIENGNQVGEVLSIPRGMVKRMKTLKI